MKWYAKYWWLFWKYQELQKKYNELVEAVDHDFWKDIVNV